jgi:hypothetical protein
MNGTPLTCLVRARRLLAGVEYRAFTTSGRVSVLMILKLALEVIKELPLKKKT